MRWAKCLCLASILLAAVTVLHAPPPAAAQACTLDPTVDGNGDVATVERTIGTRRYLLRVPAGIAASEATLVLSLHGFAMWPNNEFGPEWQEYLSQLSRAADQHKFIVAYPEGRPDPLPVGWTYTGWDPLHSSSPDVDFLVDVVEDISDDYCVDAQHVHAEGLSMGAAMAQRVACEEAGVFASVLSHSGTDVERNFLSSSNPSDQCSPSRPISVFLYCGEDDTSCRPIDPVLDDWTDRLACPLPASPIVPFGTAQHYVPCAAGTIVWHRIWADTEHLYPTDPAVLDRYHAEMMYLFAGNPLP